VLRTMLFVVLTPSTGARELGTAKRVVWVDEEEEEGTSARSLRTYVPREGERQALQRGREREESIFLFPLSPGSALAKRTQGERRERTVFSLRSLLSQQCASVHLRSGGFPRTLPGRVERILGSRSRRRSRTRGGQCPHNTVDTQQQHLRQSMLPQYVAATVRTYRSEPRSSNAPAPHPIPYVYGTRA